jgi:hypothetical protein
MTDMCRRCVVKDSQLDDAKNELATWRKKYTDLLYKTLNVDEELIKLNDSNPKDKSRYPASGYD